MHCMQTINRHMLRIHNNDKMPEVEEALRGQIYDLFRVLIFNAILSRMHLCFMVNKFLQRTRQRNGIYDSFDYKVKS